MNLSKSKYCQGIQCKKILWLNKYKPWEREEVNNESVLENGTRVGEVAKTLFGDNIDIEFNEDLSKMIKDTEIVINNNKDAIITEASFNYNNNFCSVDILIKRDNDYKKRTNISLFFFFVYNNYFKTIGKICYWLYTIIVI